MMISEKTPTTPADPERAAKMMPFMNPTISGLTTNPGCWLKVSSWRSCGAMLARSSPSLLGDQIGIAVVAQNKPANEHADRDQGRQPEQRTEAQRSGASRELRFQNTRST